LKNSEREEEEQQEIVSIWHAHLAVSQLLAVRALSARVDHKKPIFDEPSTLAKALPVLDALSKVGAE